MSTVTGYRVPRIYTPPLVTGPPGPCECGCALTPSTFDEEGNLLTRGTSFGWDVIEFARDVLDHPLDPWQQFLVIHGGELLPDGRPRFRHLVVLVSRQNGKTEVPVVLSLFWQFVDRIPLILGTSTKLDYAKESLVKAVSLAEAAPGLAPTPNDRRRWFRQANGEQESFWGGCRYKIAASNAEGGRSLTVHRLVLDELRQHHDYSAWGASVPAGNAVRDFQAWALSNAGDDRSVVLNDKRAAALSYIETGDGDERLGLFEWSAPETASPLDIDALAQANPNLGHRIDPEALMGEARTAVELGGEALTTFKTEVMCIRVPRMDPAIDMDRWTAPADDNGCLAVGTLDDARSRLALVFDIAPDGQHATLAAAGRVDDERVRVEVVESWSGTGCVDALRRDLPGWIERVRPHTLGWFPAGPAAALAADMTASRVRGWPPRGVKVADIKDTAAVCMGFAEDVKGARLLHSGQALLTDHVTGVQKLKTGDRWVFSRRGDGHADAAYGAAGAAHLAKNLPKLARPGGSRIIRARRPDGQDAAASPPVPTPRAAASVRSGRPKPLPYRTSTR